MSIHELFQSSFKFNSLPSTVLPLLSAFVVLCWTLVRLWKSPLGKLPYPPGPPSKSWISGNLSDIPPTKSWIAYTEWAKTYGDIVHFQTYGQHTIILNSIDAVTELFEKRSNLYSDRPRIPMIDLMGWDFNTGLIPYGDLWRKHRRVYQQTFRPVAALSYRPIQTRKVHDMLYGLLTSPDNFREHYRTVTAAIIMSTVYGHDISAKDDYFVSLAEAAVASLSSGTLPGAVVVNALPLLRFLPAWFPGARFKRVAAAAKKLTTQMQEVPFEFVEKNMASGTAAPCLLTGFLNNCRSKEEYQVIKQVSATSYAAGADTTVSALGTFFYTMTAYTEVQERAQHEIDTVIGTDRLVNYEDRKSLPYVEALYRETLRRSPVLPLGVPHAITDDDVYKGYHIPKGKWSLNARAISHDSAKYEEPDKFDPDRFFDQNGDLNDNDMMYVFGFGRRMCPGRHMGSATLWLSFATVLQAFDIRKKTDILGRDIPISGEYSDGLVSHPLPHECSIVPRSDEARRLIMEVVTSKI
ncbi:cytochrome P450 [Flammula alnicola]|nr:cytochrome P450 [Flammula alnicola]